MTDAKRAASRFVHPVTVAAVVVVAFIVIASLYAALVPLGQPIDEPSHLGYAHLIADHLALPSATVPEKQQPPLYYLFGASLLHLGVPDQGIRALSVAFGTGFVVTVMLGAHALMPRRPWVAVGAGTIVAAVPAIEAGSGAISNDSASWLCGALLVLVTVLVIRDPRPSMPRAVGIGAALGVSVLSKETAWVLCLVLLAVVAWQWRASWSARLAAGVALPVVALCGWWFGRNLTTFHRLTPPLSPLTNAPQYLRHVSQLRGFVSASVRSLTGPETTTGLVERSDWAAGLTWVFALTIGGLTIAACVCVGRRFAGLSVLDRHVSAVATVALVAVFVAYIANSVILDLQPQVRYLAVVAVVPATACAWMIARMRDRFARVAAAAGLAALAAALDIDSLRVAASVRG